MTSAAAENLRRDDMRKRASDAMALRLQPIVAGVMAKKSPAAIGAAIGRQGSAISSEIAVFEIYTWRPAAAPFDPPADFKYLNAAERKDWIAAGLRSGRAPAQVAVALGVRPRRMRRWCRENGVSLADGRGGGVVVNLALGERQSRFRDEAAKADPKGFARLDASPAWSELEASRPVSLMEAGSGRCKWPCWRDGEAPRMVCGAAVDAGVYCAQHGRMAYRPAPADDGGEP